MTEVETPTADKTAGQKTSGYVILKEIENLDDLQKILEAGEAQVYVVYNHRVEARDGSTAVKKATIGDDSVDEGSYVPVAASSFRPRKIKQVVQVAFT